MTKRRNTRGYKAEQEWHIFNRLKQPIGSDGAGDFQFYVDQWVIGSDDDGHDVNVLKIDDEFHLHSGVPLDIGAFYHYPDSGVVNVMNIPITSDSDTGSLHGFRSSVGHLPIVTHIGVADGLGGISRRYSEFDGDINFNRAGIDQPFTGISGLDITSSNYGHISLISEDYGGLGIYGLSEGDNAPMAIYGLIGSNDPTDTLSAIQLVGGKSDGSDSWQALGNSETVLKVKNYTTDLITVLGNGYTGFGKIPEYTVDVLGKGYISDDLYVGDFIFGGTAVTATLKIAATDAVGEAGANIEFRYGTTGGSRAAYYNYHGKYVIDVLPAQPDEDYYFLVQDFTTDAGMRKSRTIAQVIDDLGIGAFTEGAVLFGGSDGTITENPDHLFWDDTTDSWNLTITGTLTVLGNITQNGSNYITHAEHIEVESNTWILNNNETGAGVTNSYSGTIIERGTVENYYWGFDEVNDTFVLGQIGISETETPFTIAELQAVLTRPFSASLHDNGIFIWDASSLWAHTVENLVYDAGGLKLPLIDHSGSDTDVFLVGSAASNGYVQYRTAAQVLSDIGAQAAITPQALTKTDDTNVTLTLGGTPASALLQAVSLTLDWAGTLSHERGGLEADVSAYNGLVKISGGVTSSVTDNSSNWNTAYGWGDHAGLYFYDKKTISDLNNTVSSGSWKSNVNAPTGHYYRVLNWESYADTYSSQIAMRDGTGGDSQIFFRGQLAGVWGSWYEFIHSGNFETEGDAVYLRLDASNDPLTGDLQISSGDLPYIQMYAASDAAYSAKLQALYNWNTSMVLSGYNGAYILSSGTGNSYTYLYSNGTVGLTLDASQNATFAGNVGIGVLPECIFHVRAASGDIGVIKIEGGNGSVTSVGEINSQLDFGSNDGSVNNTGNIGGRIASVTESANGALTGLAFYTFAQSRTPDDLAEAVRIDYAGNVGIGTPTTKGKLTILGNGSADQQIFSLRDAITYGWDWTLDGAVDGDLKLWRVLADVGTEVVNFERATGNTSFAGNVGIGTVPSYSLHVAGKIARTDSYMDFKSTETSFSYVFRDPDSNAYYFSIRPDSVGTYLTASNSYSAKNMILYQGGNTGFFGDISSIGDIDIASGKEYQINSVSINTAGTLSNVAYLNQANSFSENQSIMASLGINEASPSALLDIKSNATSNTVVRVDNSVDGTNIFQIYEGGSGDGQVYVKDRSGNVDVKLNTFGDSWIVGDFAVGSTSATAKLDVTGDAVISSYTTIGAAAQTSYYLDVNGAVRLRNSSLTINGVAYTFPASDGSNDYVLTTNGSGVLSWTTKSGGTGGTIVSLNGLSDTTQTFSTPNTDANITLSISSASANHAFTAGWTGTLADGRIASASTWNAKVGKEETGNVGYVPKWATGGLTVENSVIYDNGSTIGLGRNTTITGNLTLGGTSNKTISVGSSGGITGNDLHLKGGYGTTTGGAVYIYGGLDSVSNLQTVHVGYDGTNIGNTYVHGQLQIGGAIYSTYLDIYSGVLYMGDNFELSSTSSANSFSFDQTLTMYENAYSDVIMKLYAGASSYVELYYGGTARFATKSTGVEVNGIITANNDVEGFGSVTTSDVRLKRDFIQIEDALGIIKNWNGYSFIWKDRPERGRIYGWKAQEMLNTTPELVKLRTDNYYGIDYGSAVPILGQGINELREKVETVEEKIERLEMAEKALKLENEDLRKRILILENA